MIMAKKTKVVVETTSEATTETKGGKVDNRTPLERLRDQIRKAGDLPTQEQGEAYLDELFATHTANGLCVELSGWQTIEVDFLADDGIIPRCILAASGDVDTEGEGRLLPDDADEWYGDVQEGQRKLTKKNVEGIMSQVRSGSYVTAPGLGVDIVRVCGAVRSANGRHRTKAGYTMSTLREFVDAGCTMPIRLSMADVEDVEAADRLFSAYDATMKNRDGVDMVTIVTGSLVDASVKSQTAMLLASRLEGAGQVFYAKCTPPRIANYVREFPEIGHAAKFLRDVDERQSHRDTIVKKVSQVVPPAYLAVLDVLAQLIDARNVDAEFREDLGAFAGPYAIPSGWCDSRSKAITESPADSWAKVEFADDTLPAETDLQAFGDLADFGPLTQRVRKFVLDLVEAFADRDNAEHSATLRELAKRLAKGVKGYATGRDGVLADVFQGFLIWSGLWTLPSGKSSADLTSLSFLCHLGKLDTKLEGEARKKAVERRKFGGMPRLGGFDLRPCERKADESES